MTHSPSSSSAQTIIDVTLSLYTNLNNRFPTELHTRLTDIIKHLLDNRSSYPDCVTASIALTGTSQPIDKLYEILQIPAEPIPSPDIARHPANDQAARRKSRPWSSYEDSRLLCGIYRYGIENWNTISRFVGNGRTRSQCSQRWQRGLDPRLSKDQWTYAEDVFLLRLVQTHGDKAWTQIAMKMGNRSDVQCRYRYKQMQKDLAQTPGIRKAQSGGLLGNPTWMPIGAQQRLIVVPPVGQVQGYLRASRSVPALPFKAAGERKVVRREEVRREEMSDKKNTAFSLFGRGGNSSETEELVWD